MSFTLSLFALVAGLQDPPKPQTPPARPQPMEIPRALVLARGDARIVVDGSLQDWPNLPAILLDDPRQLSGTALGAYRGASDLAARFFMTWDDEAIYVAGRVMDDWHVRLKKETQRFSEIPPADSVLITFDPNRDTSSMGFDGGRREDSEYWLAQVEDQEQEVVRWDRFRGTARMATGAVSAVKREPDDKTTNYEARLLWSDILPHGVKPEAGMVLDLQIVVSDFDEPTDPMPQTRLGWTFGMGTRIDPGLMGSIMLSAKTASATSKLVIPKFPSPPAPNDDAVPGRPFWLEFAGRLRRTQPALVTADTPDPAFAGGEERHDVLVEFDRQLALFPRVDFLEFQQRIHRRMNRECAGITAGGLPFLLDDQLDRVQREGARPVEPGALRIHRLPQGGFLVRSATSNFAIDPSGYAIERKLWGALDFVLLTRPLDETKRNDQLLLRMASAKKAKGIVTHIALHVPGLYAEDLPIVVPGKTYVQRGVEIKVLGSVTEKGLVTQSIGYHVRWATGQTLLVTGHELQREQLPEIAELDVLILSAYNPDKFALAKELKPKLTVLAEVMQISAYPPPSERVSLDQAFDLQRQLQPLPSVILAPGEAK